MVDQDGDAVLKAKYRDYCSAKVADAILSLTPAEIYSIAESEARAGNQTAPASYNDAIRFATRKIREQLNLPEYEDWARRYQEDPSRYDSDLLGLWQSEETEPASE